MTAVGAIADGLAPGEGGEHFGKKALRVHVAPWLSQPLRGFALWGQIEVVHMEQGALVEEGENAAQGGLSRGAGAVQCHQSLGVGAAVAVNGGEQWQQPGQVLFHHPIGRGIGPAVAVTVVDRRHPGFAVVLQRPVHILPGEGQVVEQIQAVLQPLTVGCDSLSGVKEEGGQGGGFQPLSLAGRQRQAAQAVSQRFCEGRIGVPLHVGPLRVQPSQNGLWVQDQMAGAHAALVEKFDGVLELQLRVIFGVLFQQRGQWVHGITPEG